MVQLPTLTPAGRLLTAQVAFVASVVVLLLVQLKLPL
jgi:hypothetical protein